MKLSKNENLTQFQHFQILNSKGFSKDELLQSTPIIRQNTIHSIKTVITAMNDLKIEQEDLSLFGKFLDLSLDFKETKQNLAEIKKLSKAIVRNQGFLDCLSRSHEFVLQDSAEYFIGKVS